MSDTGVKLSVEFLEAILNSKPEPVCAAGAGTEPPSPVLSSSEMEALLAAEAPELERSLAELVAEEGRKDSDKDFFAVLDKKAQGELDQKTLEDFDRALETYDFSNAKPNTVTLGGSVPPLFQGGCVCLNCHPGNTNTLVLLDGRDPPGLRHFCG